MPKKIYKVYAETNTLDHISGEVEMVIRKAIIFVTAVNEKSAEELAANYLYAAEAYQQYRWRPMRVE